ncbi:MAG: enoyl-CoA hydratase/isomerase family protein [Acidimicrobiia bacterium]
MTEFPTDVVTYDRDGAIAVVTLRRPRQLNSLDAATAAALLAASARAAEDADVRAVVITGEGKAFSAGADIKEFGSLETAEEFRFFLRDLEAACRAWELLPQPVIAAVNGMALGGGLELALGCDLRVADPGARFGLPEIKLGILPGAGGTQRLPRLVPLAVATQMILSGEPIDAAEALRIGLVNEVTDAGSTVERAKELARVLAQRPPLALATAKRLLDRVPSLPLEAATELERDAVSMLFTTADRAEGVAAFTEKRTPRFTGQ